MSNRLLKGRYELIEKIGEGGMAIVYKGKDRFLNRYVAIKSCALSSSKTKNSSKTSERNPRRPQAFPIPI
ncbi:MAG: hypothetical protein ACLSFO_07745 [Anaerovoracaceae bacterium]